MKFFSKNVGFHSNFTVMVNSKPEVLCFLFGNKSLKNLITEINTVRRRLKGLKSAKAIENPISL